MSHLTCVSIICSVLVAEWPPFGKELLTLFTICSLCIFDYFSILFNGLRTLPIDKVYSKLVALDVLTWAYFFVFLCKYALIG